ncbi:MAG: coenzyme F420-0:L-glutamate ligase, partial [Candidatus Binatia bacterium]
GWVCANSGVDRSNQSAEGEATLLPVDADKSASLLRERLERRFGVSLAVVITDTFGRAWRLGQVDLAIGSSGIEVLRDYGGREDGSGRPLEHTVVAVVDQLAAASGLVVGKNEGIPAVLVRGYCYAGSEEPASRLIRPAADDLFR